MEQTTDAGHLRRWWQEHSELDRVVKGVSHAIESAGAQTASAALDELEEALEAHFTVEENVYFPLIESISARHATALEDARREHQELREGLENLQGLIEQEQFVPAQRSFALLLERFRSHEVAETTLITALSGSESR